MSTLYVAGPMTGYPDFNFPAFDAATAVLTEAGHTVLNPAAGEGLELGRPWDWYLRRALKLLVAADGVALLPGWEASRGARLEVHVAHQLGMSTLPVRLWRR